jgi:hypothetical protein
VKKLVGNTVTRDCMCDWVAMRLTRRQGLINWGKHCRRIIGNYWKLLEIIGKLLILGTSCLRHSHDTVFYPGFRIVLRPPYYCIGAPLHLRTLVTHAIFDPPCLPAAHLDKHGACQSGFNLLSVVILSVAIILPYSVVSVSVRYTLVTPFNN